MYSAGVVISIVRARLADANPVALFLCAAAAVIGFGILKDVALLLIGRDRELGLLLDWLTLHALQAYRGPDGICVNGPCSDDSWMPIYRAVEYFRSAADPQVYRTIFFEQHTKFQYPPTSLLPFLALDTVGVDAAKGLRLMQVLSAGTVIGIVAAATLLARETAAQMGLKQYLTNARAAWLLFACVTVGTLFFYPIMFAVRIGQIQILIDLAICIALLCWLRDRKGVAAAFVAFSALIKPQYALLLVWALIRRETQFAVAFALVALPAGILSLGIFGLAEHLDYLSVLSYISRHGEVYWPNQSMNGLLNRLLVDVNPLKWSYTDFAPFHPVVYFGTLVSSIALIVLGLGYRPRWVRSPTDSVAPEAKRTESILDLCTAVMVLTIAAPVAWEHHYGVSWPIMIVACIGLVGLYVRGRHRDAAVLLGGLATSYFLISNYFTPLERFAFPPWNVVHSYIFAGGLLLLAVLVRFRSDLGKSLPRPAAAIAG